MKAKWFGVRLPLLSGVPAIATLCVEHNKKLHTLEVEARNPLEAYYGLRWAIMKEFGVSQLLADDVVARAGILPDGDEIEHETDNTPPF